MADTKTVRVKVLRDFNDAGEERRFTAGDVITIAEGAAVNFQAAGLVERVTRATRVKA